MRTVRRICGCGRRKDYNALRCRACVRRSATPGSFTASVPWAEIERRRLAGESGYALALEYGIRPNTLYRRVVRKNLPRAPRFRGFPRAA